MSLKVGIKRKRVQISDSLSFNHLGVESSRQPKMNRKIPKTTFSVTFMTAQMISNNVPMIIIFSSKVLRFFRLCKPLLEHPQIIPADPPKGHRTPTSHRYNPRVLAAAAGPGHISARAIH